MKTKSTILMKLLQLMTLTHPFGNYLEDLLNHTGCLTTSIILTSSVICSLREKIPKHNMTQPSIPRQTLGQFHPSFDGRSRNT